MIPGTVNTHHIFGRLQPALERWLEEPSLDGDHRISLGSIFLAQRFSHAFGGILGN